MGFQRFEGMGKNNKKADMSIWIIVTAALALMALVVLAAILTGRIRIFSESLQSCAAKQGRCEPISDAKFPTCPNDKALVTNTDCDTKKTKEICCVQVFTS